MLRNKGKYENMKKIINIVALIVFSVLTVASALVSCYRLNETTVVFDIWHLNFGILLLAVITIPFIGKKIEKVKRGEAYLLVGNLLYTSVLGLCFTFIGNSEYQYLPIYLINTLFVYGIIVIQWFTCKKITEDGQSSKSKLVGIYYLMIIPFCFPLYTFILSRNLELVYVLFTSLAMLGMCYSKKLWGQALAIAAILCSIRMSNASYILVTAIFAIMLYKLIREKQKRYLAFLFLLVLVSILAYQPRNLALVQLSMGLQDSGEIKGAYNGYDQYLEELTESDPILMQQIAVEEINNRLDWMNRKPMENINFFSHKLVRQWTDGEMGSRTVSRIDNSERGKLFDSFYEGNLSFVYMVLTQVFQGMIYFFCLMYVLKQFSKRKAEKEMPLELSQYLGIFTVSLGMLFHMIWVADSYQNFWLFMLLIPYAVQGFIPIRHQD